MSWLATAARPVDHPLAPYLDRGLRLKHPERVSDPVWRMLDGQQDHLEGGSEWG